MFFTVIVLSFLCSVTGNEEPIIEGCYHYILSSSVCEYEDQDIMLNFTCKLQEYSLAWSFANNEGVGTCWNVYNMNIDFITIKSKKKYDGYILSCYYKAIGQNESVKNLTLRYKPGDDNDKNTATQDKNNTNIRNRETEYKSTLNGDETNPSVLCSRIISGNPVSNNQGNKNDDKNDVIVAVSSLLLIAIVAGIMLWYRRNITSMVHRHFNLTLNKYERANRNKNTKSVEFGTPQLLTTYSDVNDYVPNNYVEPYVPAVPHYTQAIPKWARNKTNQNQNTGINSTSLGIINGNDTYEYIPNENSNKKPGINYAGYVYPISIAGESDNEKAGADEYAYPTTGANYKSENEAQDTVNYDYANPLFMGRKVGNRKRVVYANAKKMNSTYYNSMEDMI